MCISFSTRDEKITNSNIAKKTLKNYLSRKGVNQPIKKFSKGINTKKHYLHCYFTNGTHAWKEKARKVITNKGKKGQKKIT